MRKLRTGMMPPAGAPKPAPAARTTFTAALEAALDRAAARRLDPGTPALHRLNRAEYGNAIRDLLALDVDVGGAAAAGRFRRRLRQHRRRARRVAGADRGLCGGGGEDQPAGRRRSVDRARSRRLTACPAICRRTRTSTGCRSARAAASSSATRFRSTPSTDLQVGQAGGGAGWAEPAGRAGRGRRPLRDDRRRARHAAGAGATRTPRGGRAAHDCRGERGRAATPTAPTASSTSSRGRPASRRSPSPARSTPPGPGDTPSRRGCSSARPRRPPTRTAVRAHDSGRRWPTRAYRRPVAAASTGASRRCSSSTAPGAAAVRSRRASSGRWRASSSIRSSCSGSSASRPTSRRARPFRITDLELASRLSFFLWSSIPDDELLAVAAPGRAEGRRRRSSARCGACSPIREPTRWSTNFAGAVAVPARAEERPAGFAGLRRQPAPVVPARDGAALPHHPARGPQHRRSARRRLHVRRRAPGASTTASPAFAARVCGASRCPPTARAAGCSATAASSRSPRRPTARRRCSAASGCSRTCSARRRRSRRPASRPISTRTRRR